MSPSDQSTDAILAETRRIQDIVRDGEEVDSEQILELLKQRDAQIREVFGGSPAESATSELAECAREILKLDTLIVSQLKKRKHELSIQLNTLQRGQTASRSYNAIQDD